jgi:hypothetical protein
MQQWDGEVRDVDVPETKVRCNVAAFEATVSTSWEVPANLWGPGPVETSQQDVTGTGTR